MKVGVISSGSPDYLIDIVTDGLIRLLGRQSVSLDYNQRGGLGGAFAHLFSGFQGPEPFDIFESEVLIASSRSAAAMRQWIRKTGKKAVAFIDGEDSDPLALHDLNEVKVYFKREYLKGRNYPEKVRPLPFAAIPEPVFERSEIKEKVFYSGSYTHPFRGEVSKTLIEIGFPPAPSRDKAAYNSSIMSSLVGISVRGNGWDTYRYWEIPYFGAAMLAQRPGIVIPGDFVDGVEAVFYDDAADMKRKLLRMVEDVNRTVKIGEAGRKASLERHLSVNRARTVLEAL